MIGLLAGSFDLIHPGYIRMFKHSKTTCDKLIVALQGDPTIERSRKCKPVQSLDDRKEILLSIKYIDDIVEYNTEKELYDLLSTLDYDIRILGEEYMNTQFTGFDLNKPVLWIKRDHDYSTTKLKESIYQERCLRRNTLSF